MTVDPLGSAHRIQHALDLLRELVARELKVKYERSVLGLGWSLLNPFLQLLLYTFVFGNVLDLKIPHYSSFVFAGLLVWSWFASALQSGAGSISSNRELVRRPGFPVAVLPVLAVASNGISFLLALPVLFLFLLFDGGTFNSSLLALPLLIALQFLLTLGPACLIAASNVRYRDTQHLVGVALMFGFYLTPVFYNRAAIPEAYHLIFAVNPVAALVDAYRAILLQGRWPDLTALFLLLLLSLCMLAVGYRAFERARVRFAEEL